MRKRANENIAHPAAAALHDVCGYLLALQRLPSLAPQLLQIGHAALIELEVVALPLDHAFGFELADVGVAAIKVLRQRRLQS